MRVITGLAKGKPLKAPKGVTTRPTTDRIKEALFNILGAKVVDALFLDLFAGSGAIGIEALSRGAKKAVLIEKDINAIKIIKSNLVSTKLEDFAEVYRNDIINGIEILGRKGIHFDIIFLDPPYLQNLEIATLEKIDLHRILKNEGIIVVESSKKTEMPQSIGELKLVRQEKYGDTLLNFYKTLMEEAD